MHTVPVSRAGGIGIVLGITLPCSLAVWADSIPALPFALVPGFAMIAGVSVLDDRRSVGVGLRLSVQVAAALLFATGGYALSGQWLPGVAPALPLIPAVALSVLMLVWLTNLYNFMDGMDGLAAAMAITGFGTLAWLGILAGQGGYALVCALICAATAGFLLFNFPPARLFMGDTGSATLGFLAGAMSLWAAGEAIAPLWVCMLVFSPFLVDATVTLVRRALQGKRLSEAHREHAYQRLVGAGWSQRRTLMHAWVVMVACSASAVFAMHASVEIQWVIVSFWLVFYVLVMYAVGCIERGQ